MTVERTVGYVSVADGSLFARFGSIQESTAEDEGKRALQLLSVMRTASFDNSTIEVDTIPHPAVDQIAELTGVSHLDALVLDPREYGVPVLLGSIMTLRRFHPFLVFSINPPGFKRSIDTVEHYMRAVEICTREHYSVVAKPDRYTHALRYMA